MLTPPIFLIVFGLMCIFSVYLIVPRNDTDNDLNIAHFIMNTDFQKIMTIRALVLSGIMFLGIGVTLFVGGF